MRLIQYTIIFVLTVSVVGCGSMKFNNRRIAETTNKTEHVFNQIILQNEAILIAKNKPF